MSRWPADNEAALIAFYGDPRSIDANLVWVTPPFRMTYEGTAVPRLRFHKKCAAALLAALTTVWDYYGHDQAKLDALGISKTAGTFNPRYIAGTTRWSNHAFGAAIDINADDNGFYKGKGNIPPPMIAAFKAQGARWGGDYHGRTDPMHFEFCESGEPEQSFEAWLAHYGVADAAHPVVLASLGVTAEMRQSMARHILDFEARYSKDHHLEVYLLPANDGGGRYEVAGINEKYDGPEAAKLKAMVEAAQFDAAETEAERYILQNTNPAAPWATSAALEFYLRDCVFNRGAHGAARILQHACGVSSAWKDAEDDGDIGPKSRAAIAAVAPADLLTRLRAARESYERNIVGYRANFWNGLVNRWDHALAIAKTYPMASAVPSSPAVAQTDPRQDLILQILLDEVLRIKKLTATPTVKDPPAMDAPTTSPNSDLLKQLLGALQSLALPAPAAGAATPTGPAPAAPDLLGHLQSIVGAMVARQGGVGSLLAQRPALASLNLPIEVVHTLETIVNWLPVIARFVPPLQVAVPFVPLIEGGLNLVEELQSSPAHGPHAIIDVIVKHLEAAVANVQALKPTLQPVSPIAAAA